MLKFMAHGGRLCLIAEHDGYARAENKRITKIINTLGEETRLLEPFIYKIIILPRQARDEHRENSKKDAFP